MAAFWKMCPQLVMVAVAALIGSMVIAQSWLSVSAFVRICVTRCLGNGCGVAFDLPSLVLASLCTDDIDARMAAARS